MSNRFAPSSLLNSANGNGVFGLILFVAMCTTSLPIVFGKQFGFLRAPTFSFLTRTSTSTSRPSVGRKTMNLNANAAAPGEVESLRFLTSPLVNEVAKDFGTPVYVYDAKLLKEQATKALQFPNAFGLTVRFAMKSSPNAMILKLFDSMGLHFDASSIYEVERALACGIEASKISLSSQELTTNFEKYVEIGLNINACSLEQIKRYGEKFPGGQLGLRFNPGLGSGGTTKTNVGGPSSSFGIWYELMPQVQELVAKYNLDIVRIHTHIGSGSDPKVWQKAASLSLNLCSKFPNVDTLNLGGGYKVGRMEYEESTDLQVVGTPVKALFEEFALSSEEGKGKKLKLEIEPGTFLVANSASLVSTIQDKVSTGKDGFTFLKLDTGMTEVLRPSLYGAQHPLIVVKNEKNKDENREETEDYVVVGHCCESGDLLTPLPGEPESIGTRKLTSAVINDFMVIEGCGAYCGAMNTKNYNSFPEVAEVMLTSTNTFKLVRKRQTLQQIIENEITSPLEDL